MSKPSTLHFLGIGGAFAPQLGNTSAWFSHDGDFVLIDCGESVFEQLVTIDEFKSAKRILLAVTHLHCDHVGSLGTLCSYAAMVSHQSLEIYYPDIEKMRLYLDVVGIDHSFYQPLGEVPSNWNLSIIPYQVEHASDMRCYGYWFKDLGFYFSGDAADIPDEVLAKFLDGTIGEMYQDTTTIPSTAHGFIERIEKKIPEKERGRYHAIHLPNKEAVSILREKGFSVAS